MNTNKSQQNIGAKIRALRISYGLSQADFGERVGSNRGAINSYERNSNYPPKNILWNIMQVTGIEQDYFDTDMTLSFAFSKYKIDPSLGLKIKNVSEVSCSVYDGIKSFASGIKSIKDFELNIHILKELFNLSDKLGYHFIRIKDNEAEPFAKHNDIVVVADCNVSNNDIIIAIFQNNIVIFRYFIAGIDDILLKGDNSIEIKISKNEISKINILGIIKGIYRKI